MVGSLRAASPRFYKAKGVAMAGGLVHTVHWGGEWVNEIDGQGRAGQGFWTKQEAQRAGRALATRLKVAHLVYDQYGALEEDNSYWDYPDDGLAGPA
jgi:hypothetical protein